MSDRDRLRQLIRTYGLKGVSQEIGWNTDYILSVLDGMNGCPPFWQAVTRLTGRLQVGIGLK